MSRYSGIKVFLEGLTGNKGWKPAWREPEPKSHYDVIIIGGGGMVSRRRTICPKFTA